MASIKCGKCKGTHATVAQVRECYSQPTLPGIAPAPLPGFRGGAIPPRVRIAEAAKSLPDVPTARYAIERMVENSPEKIWRFYRVDRPQTGKWKGYTFLKVQASDEWYKITNLANAADIIEAIAADSRQAAEDYGHQLGECSICGRTLTDPDSIARGIGPVCAGKVGW